MVLETFDSMPPYFIENRGQLPAEVSHYVQGTTQNIYFASSGLTISLAYPELKGAPDGASERDQVYVVKLDFVGANPNVKVEGMERNLTAVSYLKGNLESWRPGLRSYRAVIYRELWPGVDLIYRGDGRQIKYHFVVRPGADPSRIRMAYRGAKVKINAGGELEMSTPAGSFTDVRPVSFQERDGERTEVSTGYRLGENDGAGRVVYGFELGAYDASRELIIDPAIIHYSGFIGGTNHDSGQAIAVDSDGNGYVTGFTVSADLPVLPNPGAYDVTVNGARDVFVAKVKADGRGLVYCTYVGGDGFEIGRGIAVDNTGHAYVTGVTASTNFPLTPGVLGDYDPKGNDGFVFKLNPTGTGLVYSTSLGGDSTDEGTDIAVDNLGNAYVIGHTSSLDFPVSRMPFGSLNRSAIHTFVVKINPDAFGFGYSTLIGGQASTFGQAIALDSTGRVYVTGFTSAATGFPLTPGAFDATYTADVPGEFEGFIAKIGLGAAALEYCSYIGGRQEDRGKDIAVDGAGQAFVVGSTRSRDFPTTAGAFQSTIKGRTDAFVVKVNATGTAMAYSSYLGGAKNRVGGAANTVANGVVVNSDGIATIVGETESLDFPVTAATGELRGEIKGPSDVFLTRVKPDGSSLALSSYFGGLGQDQATGIAIDAAGNTFITGETNSIDSFFSVKNGPGLTNKGSGDAFVVKIGSPLPPIIAKQFEHPSIPLNGFTTLHLSITNPNEDRLEDIAFTDNFPPGLVVGPMGVTNNTCGGAVVADPGTSLIALTGGKIEKSSQCRVSVEVQGTTEGSKNNVTEPVTASGVQGNRATASLQVIAPAKIAKAFGAATITYTDPDPTRNQTSLTLTIENPNSTQSLSGVEVTDPLPPGLVVATPSGLANNCGGTATAAPGSSAVSLTGGLLGAGASCTLTVRVTATSFGLKNNLTSAVKSIEGGEGNAATATILVVAPPVIAKSFAARTIPYTDPDPTKNQTDLSLTITNPNAGMTLTGIAVQDALPGGLVVANPNGAINTCGGTVTALPGSSMVSLTGATLSAGSQCSVTVKVMATSGGTKNNVTGPVKSIEGGVGNVGTATLSVIQPPAVGVFFTPRSIGVRQETTLLLVINNPNSAETLQGVGLVNHLPLGLSISAPPLVTGGCGGATGTSGTDGRTITVTNGTVAAGETCQVQVRVRASTSGTKVNVTGPATSVNGGKGNSASAVLSVSTTLRTISQR